MTDTVSFIWDGREHSTSLGVNLLI